MTWNLAYEATPAGSASPAEGDNEIRNTRLEVRSRVDQEHAILNTSTTGQSVHKPGSAVVYFQAAEPTLRPDGLTSLNSNDTGRLWVDSNNNNLLQVYNDASGTYEGLTVDNINLGGSLSVPGTLEVTGETTLNDHLTLGTGADIKMGTDALITTGGESAPDCSDGGICLSQVTTFFTRPPILTCKSSAVLHPFTTIAETDTYCTIGISGGLIGGVELQGLSSNSVTSIKLKSYCADTDTTVGSSARGAIELYSYKTDGGTGVTSFAGTENILMVSNAGAAKLILKANGDLYLDGTQQAFDRENDIKLSRALQLSMAGLDSDPMYRKRLEELGLIQNGMTSVGGAIKLLLGAVYQLWKMNNE